MRLISTEMIEDEMVLGRDIYRENCLIINKGATKISRYIPNLKNMGIRYIYIEDKNSKGIEIPDAVTEEARNNCKSALEKTVLDFKKNYKFKLEALQAAMKRILMEVNTNKDVQVSLIDICSTDEYTFSHSISTSVYALLMGRALHYSDKQMQELSIGAVLHDIGKILIDTDATFESRKLTDEEFEIIKLHTVSGYEALKEVTSISEASKQIILQHHERLDGSGYPDGIMGYEASEYAKIVSIADVYDALTTDRVYRKKWPTNKAIDYLIENGGTKFDPDLVRIFIQQVAVYPNGSLVRLSDGMIGIVEQQNQNAPLRPIIRVIENKNGEKIKPYRLDMMQVLSVTITESEVEIKRSKQGEQMNDTKMEEESNK